MSAPLEQVMKEVAPEAANAGGGMGRVERRITMLEKAFAEVVERHEKSLRERVGALSAMEESLHELRNRVNQSEKHHTGAMMELRSALADACMRLNGVEAAQSPATEAALPFSDPLPTAAMTFSASDSASGTTTKPSPVTTRFGASFATKTVGNGKPVTVTGVALSGGDAGNYTVSQPSGLAADITVKNLTINGAVANNKQYDGNTTATVDFTSATLVTVVSGDVVTINSSGYSASFATKTVGNGKPVTVTGVALSGGDAGNYTVTQPGGLTADITAKNLTISGAIKKTRTATA